MTGPHTYKVEDSARIVSRLENPRTGDRFDLSDTDIARVRIVMDHPESGDLVVNDDDSGDLTILEATEGKVEYTFSSAETARLGRHRIEYIVEYTDGSELTYPPEGYIELRLTEAVDADQQLEEIADPDASVATLTISDRIEMGQNPIVDVQFQEVASEADIPADAYGWFWLTDINQPVYKHNES